VQSRECLLQTVIIFQGTLFQIEKKCDENFGQTVILYGSHEAVSKAKQLIEELLNNFA
jgi:hypothetical protein